MAATSSYTGVGTALPIRKFVLRAVLLAGTDALMWILALSLATWFREGFDWGQVELRRLVTVALYGIDVHLIAAGAFGLYTGRRKLASFEETGFLSLATISGAVAALAATTVASSHFVPQSAVVAAAAYQLIGALAIRYLGRLLLEWRRPPVVGACRALIFGAGEAGREVARSLFRDAQTALLPVAFLDDDPLKRGLRMEKIEVVGSRRSIPAAAERYSADALIIAIPSVPHAEIVDVADRAQKAGLRVHVVPRLGDLLETGVRVRDIREMTLADFLSRDEVKLDLQSISSTLEGKRVLVTGAGGSIGSELCSRISSFEPDRMLMLDHSEHNLYRLAMRLGIDALDSKDLVLADIRDRRALEEVFRTHRPEVVFHAAAHKHVPLLEHRPAEAIKTNVFGTLNLLELSAEYKVGLLVNISTDKAADPINVLGMSKRVAERLTASVAEWADGTFLSVRFGNVLGSDGSVIQTFREQIAQGRPITVTHPEVTRFFMTTPEAVQLVLQAAALGQKGDLLVLDMGEPQRILDLAHRLAAELKPGLPAKIEFTGLRPGEKLHEILATDDDEMLDQPHEKLWRYRVPPLDPGVLNGLSDREELADLLREQGLIAESVDVAAFDYSASSRGEPEGLRHLAEIDGGKPYL